MGILIYQVGIFITIQIFAFFGKSSRNTAIVLISIFTLLQVFTSSLMIIQFITIFISYVFSNSILSESKNTVNHTNISQSKKEDISYNNYDWVSPPSRPDWLIEDEESIKKREEGLKELYNEYLKKKEGESKL